MKYGFGYKGSKSAIADELISVMPTADNFVDLFCGGCSITHAALLSGKYKKVIANDLDKDMPLMFYNVISRKECEFLDNPQWISRDEFHWQKASNPFVRMCWSFGGDKKSYVYSKEREPFKNALWQAVVDGYSKPALSWGLDLEALESLTTINDRKKMLNKILDERMGVRKDGSHYVIYSPEKYIQTGKYIDVRLSTFDNLGSIENLQPLANIQRLQELRGSIPNHNALEVYGADYREVAIPKNSVIYCDIPYDGKSGYFIGGKPIDFDMKAFISWANDQTEPVFVSSYDMPAPFVCMMELNKAVTICDKENSSVVERIFTLPKWIHVCNVLC